MMIKSPFSLKAMFAISVFMASSVHADNYATCLLDELPRTTNDVVAHAIAQNCLAEYPGGFTLVKQGEGRGIFGFKSGSKCTAKKATDTRSNQAAALIAIACRRLYDEPNIFGYFDKMDVEQFLNEKKPEK